MRILIVDDEPLVAETLSLIFHKHGFEAEVAHSAMEALARAIAIRPDLVLCDIDMPGRDGIALMDDLGRELPECPILVLTGFYRGLSRVHEATERLKQTIHVLTKPCQPAELLREASTMLQAAS